MQMVDMEKLTEMSNNQLAKDSFIELTRMLNFEIDSIRIADFDMGGIKTSAIGVVEKKRGGYNFNPYFLLVTDDVADILEPHKDSLIERVGYDEPELPQ
jgi:hypothetical protein